MNIILLLTMLFLAGCGIQEGGSGMCHELWADCPGIAQDYEIAESASDLEQRVIAEERFFSYYNCALGRRTPILVIRAECDVTFNYER